MHETRERLADSFRTEPVLVGKQMKKKGGNAAIENVIPGIGAFIVDQIRPYKGGHPTLWILSKLDNTDKHRMLTIVAVITKIVGINAVDDNGNGLADFQVTVPGGAVVFPIAGSGLQGLKIKNHGKATAEPLLNETDVAENQPLFTTLSAMQEAVSETIDSLAEFVIAAGWAPPPRKEIVRI